MLLTFFRCGLFITAFFFLQGPANSQALISEVMWQGSDISTADEWLEIASIVDSPLDLSGWSVTSENASGEHALAAVFPTGTVLEPGEVMVLARRTSDQSRLAEEPAIVSASLVLPNTKLLLRLLNASGSVVDEVDDGVGVPFAGANPSGTGSKASMERRDFLGAGNVKENWQTAVMSEGFKPGVPIFGTPGRRFAEAVPSPELPAVECIDPLEVAIAVQSGPLAGTSKVTVNFQAVATAGSLDGVQCSWDYGDGFQSTSCNPPSHSFVTEGTYIVHMEAKNKCGNTLVQEQEVHVFPDISSKAATVGSSIPFDGSRIRFLSALPNPVGADTGKERIDLKNLEDRSVSLEGWKIGVGESHVTSYSLHGSLEAHGSIRFFDTEIRFKLPNNDSKIVLFAPDGTIVSTIDYESASEGQEYFPEEIRKLNPSGWITQVIHPTLFQLQLEPGVAREYGNELIRVSPIGLMQKKGGNLIKNVEYLRDLLLAKKVELEFDTTLWDSDGNLVAYLYPEGMPYFSEMLLGTGEWLVDPSQEFLQKDRFISLQKNTEEIFSEAQIESKNEEQINSSGSAIQLTISEIFSSPNPKEMRDETLQKEWLEVANTSGFDVDLSAVYLRINGTKKALPKGLKASSGSLVLIFMNDMKSKLKNTGGTVELLRKDGFVLSSVEYPELKYGVSYAAVGTRYCSTTVPTPGRSNQCSIALSDSSKTAVSSIVKNKVASKPSAAVRGYAAAYASQIQGEDGHAPTLIFRAGEVESSVLPLLIGLLSAFSLPVVGFILCIRTGFLDVKVRRKQTN